MTKSKCKYCGGYTLVAGWDICDKCMVDETHLIPIAVIADAIVQFDATGVIESDRQMMWKRFGVTPMQVAAAQEEVESRYDAAHGALPGVPRRRNRYRGW